MKTTKSWKQKTKLVALAAAIGATITFSGIGAAATPAAAGTSNIQWDTVLCEAEATDGDQSWILMENDFFYMDGTGCSKLSTGFKDSIPGEGTEMVDYGFLSWCGNKGNIEKVDSICKKTEKQAITIDDWETADDSEGCLSTNGVLEMRIHRQCKIFVIPS